MGLPEMVIEPVPPPEYRNLSGPSRVALVSQDPIWHQVRDGILSAQRVGRLMRVREAGLYRVVEECRFGESYRTKTYRPIDIRRAVLEVLGRPLLGELQHVMDEAPAVVPSGAFRKA